MPAPAGCTHVTVNPHRPETPSIPCHRIAIWRVIDTGELYCGWHRFHIPVGAIKVPIVPPERLPKRTVVYGHALINGGGPHNRDGVALPKGTRNGVGICSCGRPSPWLGSKTQRRDWHTDHKLDILDQLARKDDHDDRIRR